MNEVVTAALIFTAVGVVFIVLGIPLLRGRVCPSPWYGCRTEKTLSDEKVWYAVNRVTGRDLVLGGAAVVAASLAFLVFGRDMNPTRRARLAVGDAAFRRHNDRTKLRRSEADVTGKP